MPRVIAKPDNLNERNTEFVQQPLKYPIFLNSVPKSGSHLLKNIFRMFVPVEQQFGPDFIQYANLKQHHEIFKTEQPKLAWGHLLFSDGPAMVMKNVRHILLVRDPYNWVLARGRFVQSDNFEAGLEHLHRESVNVDDFLNMMIAGIYTRLPSLKEIYYNNAVAWLGTSVRLVHYEEIIKHLKKLDSEESKKFFEELLGFGGIDLPSDWKERVLIGSDRGQSGTARENLNVKERNLEIPDILPDMQKRIVDYTAPGLREILGYK